MRVVNDSNIQHRAARARLEPRHRPYYRSLEPGLRLHIGYRRAGAGAGTWCARLFLGHGRYVSKALGTADDLPGMLAGVDFATACTKAAEWARGQLQSAKSTGGEPKGGTYLVRDAVTDYIEDYKRRSGRGLRTIEAAMNTHVLPTLGSVAVEDLTTRRLRQWHQAIAASAPKKRTGKLAKKVNKGEIPKTPDALRARRSTANNIRGAFFAALNHAFNEGRVASDHAWRRVKPFRSVDAARIRYLTADEAQRLVNACEGGDFRNLVRAALLSGARYGEIAALLTSDFNADVGTLLIRHSKGGKPRHVVLNDEGRAFFATMTTALAHDALIFTADNAPWTPSLQNRPMERACKAAQIIPEVSFHILRHTHGSLLAMAGVPMAVIAKQLGHADTRITEKHYAHLAPSYVADTIRASMPMLGIVSTSNVKPIKLKRRVAE